MMKDINTAVYEKLQLCQSRGNLSQRSVALVCPSWDTAVKNKCWTCSPFCTGYISCLSERCVRFETLKFCFIQLDVSFTILRLTLTFLGMDLGRGRQISESKAWLQVSRPAKVAEWDLPSKTRTQKLLCETVFQVYNRFTLLGHLLWITIAQLAPSFV